MAKNRRESKMYVEIEALTKIIDKNKVLDDVSLEMDKGKI